MEYRKLLERKYDWADRRWVFNERRLWREAEDRELELMALDALQDHLEIPRDRAHREARRVQGSQWRSPVALVDVAVLAGRVGAPHRQDSEELSRVLASLEVYGFAKGTGRSWKITKAGLRYLRTEVASLEFWLLQRDTKSRLWRLQQAATSYTVAARNTARGALRGVRRAVVRAACGALSWLKRTTASCCSAAARLSAILWTRPARTVRSWVRRLTGR